jgi:hypothetical protein
MSPAAPSRRIVIVAMALAAVALVCRIAIAMRYGFWEDEWETLGLDALAEGAAAGPFGHERGGGDARSAEALGG